MGGPRRVDGLVLTLAAGLAVVALRPTPARAQGRAPRLPYLLGSVVAVEAPARRISLVLDSGDRLEVAVPDAAPVLRAQPEDRTLAKAAPIAFEAIAVGDRVMVQVRPKEPGGTVTALRVVVMRQGDVAERREADQADWRARGVHGLVTATDPAAGTITVRLGRQQGAPSLVIDTAGRPVVFRRYAPDSVRFADARPSSLAEVRLGDEVRARGERSADQTRLAAEEVVFGTFRNIVGPVTAVDPEKGEVTVRDQEAGKLVAVSVGGEAKLHRLPPMLATMLARRAAAEAAPSPPEGGTRGRWRGRGGFKPDELLSRLPPLALADLQAGEWVVVSSTKGNDPDRANAIVLVAGVVAPSAFASRRGERGPGLDLPPELMDLGTAVP